MNMSKNNSENNNLISIAKKLRNEKLIIIFEHFLEYHVCAYRVIIQTIITVWSGAWMYGPQPILVKDAMNVFPISTILLGFSIVWMILIKNNIIQINEKIDTAGIVLNLLFIGIQTHIAFLLLIALNAFVPFISIAAVIRYGRKSIKPIAIATLTLLLLAAPPGYWFSRPAYFLFAIANCIALPIIFSRILIAMQEISTQALNSRDARSHFISAMSHELRTPLNAIINYAILIDDDISQIDQKKMLNILNINAKALLHRVNEVLDFTNIDEGKLYLNIKPMNLLDVINTVQAVCGNMASAKGLVLDFKIDSASTPYIEGDEGRIEQVITNLVTNAIKFTPAGGYIDVFISAEFLGDIWNINIKVADTGIGIPDKEKEIIFSPFKQLSMGYNRIEQGVGLGLYIASSISNAMDGKIKVCDNPAGGSIFSWRFKARPNIAMNDSISNIKEMFDFHKENIPSLHLLVFEDIEINRIVIDKLLTRAGHKVTFFMDGHDIFKRVQEVSPDMIFLDLHMPGVSGWDALHHIANKISIMPPIIVLTADTHSNAIRHAIDVGVAGYITKPLNAKELLTEIENHAIINK